MNNIYMNRREERTIFIGCASQWTIGELALMLIFAVGCEGLVSVFAGPAEDDLSHQSDRLAPLNAKNTAEPISGSFEISDSIKKVCAKSATDPNSSCSKVYGFLSELAREESDAVWAEAVERKIKDFISAPGDQNVRALKCRTSVCAVESISSAGLPLFRNYSFQRSTGLLLAGSVLAHEADSSGKDMVIVLTAFSRHTFESAR